MQFHLKVYRASEGVKFLTLTASNATDAATQAQAQGYRVLSSRRALGPSFNSASRSKFSVALFSQEMLALLQAGLSLVETIDILARKSKDAASRRILNTLEQPQAMRSRGGGSMRATARSLNACPYRANLFSLIAPPN